MSPAVLPPRDLDEFFTRFLGVIEATFGLPLRPARVRMDGELERIRPSTSTAGAWISESRELLVARETQMRLHRLLDGDPYRLAPTDDRRRQVLTDLLTDIVTLIHEAVHGLMDHGRSGRGSRSERAFAEGLAELAAQVERNVVIAALGLDGLLPELLTAEFHPSYLTEAAGVHQLVRASATATRQAPRDVAVAMMRAGSLREAVDDVARRAGLDPVRRHALRLTAAVALRRLDGAGDELPTIEASEQLAAREMRPLTALLAGRVRTEVALDL